MGKIKLYLIRLIISFEKSSQKKALEEIKRMGYTVESLSFLEYRE
jgi:hypothetical protein